MNARALQPFDARREIGDPQHHTIPSAWLLLTAVWQWTRSRRARTAQQNVQRSERNIRKRWWLLMLQCEAKVLGVERDGTAHVCNLITHTVKARLDPLTLVRHRRWLIRVGHYLPPFSITRLV